MKGDHETYFSMRGGVALETLIENVYSHKIENSLARTLPDCSGSSNKPGHSPGSGRADRIEAGKACWRKNTQKGTYVRPVIVYFARLSSIEIKLKRFL
jgi:hypothetical protein